MCSVEEKAALACALREVREEAGLPITVGIARTKFLAKVASQEAKPDGLLLVPPDRELAFLHPLPVRRLWGVGVKTAEKLAGHGIETVADVAELLTSWTGPGDSRTSFTRATMTAAPGGWLIVLVEFTLRYPWRS